MSDLVTHPAAHSANIDLEVLRANYDLVLNEDLDAILQEIVAAARSETGYEVSLISLTLRNVHFFKAYDGLPDELRAARVMDRCATFCQFVVASGRRLEVRNCLAHSEFPRSLAERYDIASYYGVPVRLNRRTVGALCVLNKTEIHLDEKSKVRLEELAARASVRLQELRDEVRISEPLLKAAIRPAFAEVRNLMNALKLGTEVLAISLAEIQPILGLLERIASGRERQEFLLKCLPLLQDSLANHLDLTKDCAALMDASRRVSEMVGSLEKAVIEQRGSRIELAEALRESENLARHVTEAAGGVRYRGPLPAVQVRLRDKFLINLLALSLSFIAETARKGAEGARQGGLELSCSKREGAVVLEFSRPGLDAADWARIHSVVSFFASDEEEILVRRCEQGLRLFLPT